MIGPVIKKHLHDQLIDTDPAGAAPRADQARSRRSRALDDVLGGAPAK